MRISDWSSDVCSSDLPFAVEVEGQHPTAQRGFRPQELRQAIRQLAQCRPIGDRIERGVARRVQRLPDMAVVDAEIVGKARQIVGEDFLRSEEHTSELQSLMRISYAVLCLKKKTPPITTSHT